MPLRHRTVQGSIRAFCCSPPASIAWPTRTTGGLDDWRVSAMAWQGRNIGTQARQRGGRPPRCDHEAPNHHPEPRVARVSDAATTLLAMAANELQRTSCGQDFGDHLPEACWRHPEAGLCVRVARFGIVRRRLSTHGGATSTTTSAMSADPDPELFDD